MNPELITRLVKLVEKTGDRIVLPDLEAGKAVVVMDLDAYERLFEAAALPSAVQASAGPTPGSAVGSASIKAGSALTPIQETSAFAAARKFAPSIPKPWGQPSDTPSSALLDEVVEHHHTPAPAPSPAAPAPAKSSTSIPPQNKANIPAVGDLTQEELLVRINRDIDDWKTAQDARTADSVRPRAFDLELNASPEDQFEEEERFFLEPIE